MSAGASSSFPEEPPTPSKSHEKRRRLASALPARLRGWIATGAAVASGLTLLTAVLLPRIKVPIAVTGGASPRAGWVGVDGRFRGRAPPLVSEPKPSSYSHGCAPRSSRDHCRNSPVLHLHCTARSHSDSHPGRHSKSSPRRSRRCLSRRSRTRSRPRSTGRRSSRRRSRARGRGNRSPRSRPRRRRSHCTAHRCYRRCRPHRSTSSRLSGTSCATWSRGTRSRSRTSRTSRGPRVRYPRGARGKRRRPRRPRSGRGRPSSPGMSRPRSTDRSSPGSASRGTARSSSSRPPRSGSGLRGPSSRRAGARSPSRKQGQPPATRERA
jgi:hypothetical protein